MLDVDPAAAIEIAAEAGFDAAGIWFDATTWTPAFGRRVHSALAATGVIPLDIEVVMLSADGHDHGDALVDAAVELGARNILVASREPDPHRVGDRLRALAERLDGAPTRIVLEFLPVLAIKTLGQALTAVHHGDHPALGVLVDSLHLARAGHTPADLVGTDQRCFPYLQLCDAPAAPPDGGPAALLHEALHGRLLPGEGGLPLHELLDALPEIAISLELRSATLLAAHPDPLDRARALAEATDRFLGTEPTSPR